MPISRKQQKLLFAAKRALGLSDEGFATILARMGDVGSITELERDGFEAILAFFEHLGFNSEPAGESWGDRRRGMASTRQVQYIRVLWHKYTRGNAGAAEFDKWLLHKWHVSSLRFLTSADAQKAITALRSMTQRDAA
jgi:hypothetical protein